MKRYWDSSALVDALHDSRVEKLAGEADQCARSHALTEVFSTLTGGRLGVKYLAGDAARLIRQITQAFKIVGPDGVQVGRLDHNQPAQVTVIVAPAMRGGNELQAADAAGCVFPGGKHGRSDRI